MNGPEHYRAAEKLLSDASFTSGGRPAFRANGSMHEGPAAVAMIERAVAAAQVHATLALAAVQADAMVSEWVQHPNEASVEQWRALFPRESAQ